MFPDNINKMNVQQMTLGELYQ